ncbi:uncharacterized protein LOC131875392 [Cryptomeria japonica]|uniref:uncharacterized protein LOC131875392 n=1 Tax=Cryptomeria japonica TaxID=3369 RepID=UPI0027DAB0CF|nr:uncharacterized protein LOC131875392 [Cryptomeria japonica]
MVGFALARYNEMSNNQRECLEILKAMVNLGKQIVELNEQMPYQKQHLNEAVECIVVGCSMCTSQLTAVKIFRLFPRAKEAFLDIRALEEASFVKTDENAYVIVHDIVRARGRKMAEGNRITDEEKLKNLKGIYFDEPSEQPPIEINDAIIIAT